MAFLTYRQGNYYNTSQAESEQRDIVTDRPLTMFEIDSNFYSLNTELTDFTKRYQVGAKKNSDVNSIEENFSANDANSISATGFYRYNKEVDHVPTTEYSGILAHFQGQGTEYRDVNSFQITSGISEENEGFLYYRTQYGNGDWDSWNRLVTSGELNAFYNQVETSLAGKIGVDGDENGNTIFSSSVMIDKSMAMVLNGYRRGESPSSNIYNQYSFIDREKNFSTEHILGGLDYQVASDFIGAKVVAYNPVLTNQNTDEASLKVGWSFLNNDYVCRTYAPTPTAEFGDNQIATTGYVRDTVYATITESWELVFSSKEIHGDFTISGKMQSQSARAEKAVFNQVESGDVLLKHDFITGTIPNPSDERISNKRVLYFIGNGAGEANDFVSTGKIVNSVDNNGTSKLGLYAIPNSLVMQEVAEASIWISTNQQGTLLVTHAPTPPINDDSTQIATTKWVNAKIGESFADIENVTQKFQKELENIPTMSELSDIMDANLNNYLEKSGGTMKGIIRYGETQEKINKGRDTALIHTVYSLSDDSSKKLHPIISHSVNGASWDIGSNFYINDEEQEDFPGVFEDNESEDKNNSLIFAFVKDEDYMKELENPNEIVKVAITESGSVKVAGNVVAGGICKAKSFHATSDARIKLDREKFEADLSEVNAYSYRFSRDGKRHVGLLAQEVEKVIPEAVTEQKDGLLTLDYNSVVAVLVDEVNRLKKEVEELKKKV